MSAVNPVGSVSGQDWAPLTVGELVPRLPEPDDPVAVLEISLSIAFAFGLAFVAMAYSMGKISGSHLNPAVSLAMLIARRLSLKDFFGYVIGQFAGSTAAALFLWTCFSAKDALGQNGYGTSSPLGINVGIAALVETVLSAVFILCRKNS